MGNRVLASVASCYVAGVHAAGPRAPFKEDGGCAVVTAAGRAVAADTVDRAAGNAAGVVTGAAEFLAAIAENLGLAVLASFHRGAAGTVALCSNDGTAVLIAQRWTVAAQWLVPRMPLGRHEQHSKNDHDGHRYPKACCT